MVTMIQRILLLFLLLAAVSCADPNSTDPNLAASAAAPASAPSRPLVIWNFHIDRDSRQSLQDALDSDLLSHVSIYISNRWTGVLLDKTENLRKLRWAIETCREHGVQSILVRNLWPTRPVGELDESILFDPNYYIGEIRRLREEQEKWQADCAGLDIESYGGERAPVGKYLQWGPNYKPSDQEQERMDRVVSAVIEAVGQVDFLYPAGSLRPYHFYNRIARLGRVRIAESTYYDNQDYAKVQYPYEVFGVYVDLRPENPRSPRKPFYTVGEVFGKAHRWSSRQGVFFYPREGRAEPVAEALKEYRLRLPRAEESEGGMP